MGVAEHRLEVVPTGVVRPRQHQLRGQQLLAGAQAPAFGGGGIEPIGGEGQQVQISRPQQQSTSSSEQALQQLAAGQGSIQHRGDAIEPQLTQAQPELEDFRRARALQAPFPAVGAAPAGLHVGKAGAEGRIELLGASEQQQ